MQCKTLEYLIAAPVSAIDTQIKAFESAEKEKKYEELQKHFNSIDFRPEWLTLDQIINPKWANKSESPDSLKRQIETSIKLVNSDIDKLNKMYSEYPFYVAVVDKYKKKTDFAGTAWYGKQLETEYKKVQNSKADIQNVPAQPTEKDSKVILPEPSKAAESNSLRSEPMLKGKFSVECTKSQLVALREFMKANKIKFEVVKG